MTKKLLPFAAAVAAIVGVFAVLAVAGAFDDDDGGNGRTLADGNGAELDEARCRADDTGEDCVDDTSGDALGICISEDDPNYDADQPCSDTVVEGNDAEDLPADDPGTSLNICIAGVVTCNDTVVDGTDADTDAIGGGEEGKAVAIEAAYAALAEMDGPSDAKLTSAFAVEFGNACLGVEDADTVCAEVITPGWIIELEGGNAIYVFHTDLNGNAVYAPQ